MNAEPAPPAEAPDVPAEPAPPAEAPGAPADAVEPAPTVEEATDALTAARTDSAAAQKALADAVAAQQAAEQERERTRAAVRAGPMPADSVEAAAAEQKAIAAVRAAQGGVTAAEMGVARAAAALARAMSRRDWVTAAAAADAADAASDTSDAAAHVVWHERLATAPLDTLPADAAHIRATDGAAALARLHALLPPALVDAAEARGRAELGRRDALAAAVDAAAATVAAGHGTDGPDAAREVAQADYRAAEARLLAHIQGAPARLAADRAALAAIVAAPDLTDAQRASIDALAPAPPAGDAPAEPAPEAWLAAVPDAALALIASRVAADTDLQRLAAIDAAALEHAVTAAHDALVVARTAARDASWAQQARQVALADAAAMLAAEDGHADARLLGAVGGHGVTA